MAIPSLFAISVFFCGSTTLFRMIDSHDRILLDFSLSASDYPRPSDGRGIKGEGKQERGERAGVRCNSRHSTIGFRHSPRRLPESEAAANFYRDRWATVVNSTRIALAYKFRRRIASEQPTFNRDDWGGERLRADLRWKCRAAFDIIGNLTLSSRARSRYSLRMARMMKFAKSISNASALGFEATLWATPDKLRGTASRLPES